MSDANNNHTNELGLTPVWSSTKVRGLIHESSEPGGPALLLVGRQEAEALKRHMFEAFGDEGISDQDLYYMGLAVVEVTEESHLSVSGSRHLAHQRRSDDILDRMTSWRFSTT